MARKARLGAEGRRRGPKNTKSCHDAAAPWDAAGRDAEEVSPLRSLRDRFRLLPHPPHAGFKRAGQTLA